MLNFFKKGYTVRRFSPQTLVEGIMVSGGYKDTPVKLNVQPLNPDKVAALPEGDRKVKRLKAFGSYQLSAADPTSQTQGDYLHYNGAWYECVSATPWDHTPLRHCEAEFVIRPDYNGGHDGTA